MQLELELELELEHKQTQEMELELEREQTLELELKLECEQTLELKLELDHEQTLEMKMKHRTFEQWNKGGSNLVFSLSGNRNVGGSGQVVAPPKNRLGVGIVDRTVKRTGSGGVDPPGTVTQM